MNHYALAKNDVTELSSSTSVETAKAIIRDVTAELFVPHGQSFALVQATASEFIVIPAGKTEVFNP